MSESFILERLSGVGSDIFDADLLLFRRESTLAHAIETGRGSIHCHAGKAAWVRGPYGTPWVLCCIDTIEGRGGAVTPLQRTLAEYPGSIDVYRTNPDNLPQFNRFRSILWSWENIPGRPYGHRSLLKMAFRHAIFLRWFLRPSRDNQKTTDRNPVCSAACAMADRIGGGYDPVPNLADEDVEPGHLANSTFYRYLFTLAK